MNGSDQDTLTGHRRILASRPELAGVYRDWFRRLLAALQRCEPIVEVGTGPGFLKSEAPFVVSTDIVALPWVDLVCDAASLPFRSDAVGGIVMVDVLHHLPRPLLFLAEAARVLRPGGRLAAIEPWISPISYLIYRWCHHEECRLGVNLTYPFGNETKGGLEGNAAIPYKLLRNLKMLDLPFRVVEMDRFIALPYLVTLGFKVSRPLPSIIVRLAGVLERLGNPVLRQLAATRVMALLEKIDDGPSVTRLGQFQAASSRQSLVMGCAPDGT